ncbi:MAG: hypothetical protein LC725_09705 [Lentisphaerae bacterium]|nr:hypothetical protein [Lentisphaerota bacterium]
MIHSKTRILLLSALAWGGCLIVINAQYSRNKTLSPSNPTDTWPINLQPDESAVYNISIEDSPSYELVESSSFTNFNNSDFVWSGGGERRSYSYNIMNTSWQAGVAEVNVDCVWRPVGGTGSGSGHPASWKDGWAHGTATALPADFVVEAWYPVPSIVPIGGICELRSALKKNEWEKRYVNANWSIATPAYFQGPHQNASLVQATSDQAGSYYASATCVDCGRQAGGVSPTRQ